MTFTHSPNVLTAHVRTPEQSIAWWAAKAREDRLACARVDAAIERAVLDLLTDPTR